MSSDQTPPPDPAPAAKPGRSLTQKTVSGFIWSAGGNAAQVVLRMLVLAVLARLLEPSSFGIVSAALIVISLLEVTGQVGTSQAIIQRPDLEPRDIHTAIGFTALTSCLMGALIFIFAADIAALFDMQGVEPAVQLLALAFPIKGFSAVSEALLRRWMQFRRLAGITLASYIFGYALVALTLAYLGWGVLALVYGQIAQTVLLSLCHIVFTRHVFGFGFHWPALKGLLVFSGGISLSRFANFFATNADNFIVGRMLGAEALGFYSRAFNFMTMPVGLLGNVLDLVLYPAMSSIQTEEERLRRAYLLVVGLIALTVMPLSAVMVALGPEMILVVLGPNWTEAILPFQILSSCLLFRIGYKANTILARAKGAVYRSAWRQWLFAALVVLGAWAGHFHGTSGVAAGVGVALAAQFLMMLDFGRRLTSASPGDLARVHARHLTVALLTGGGTYAFAAVARAYEMPHLVVVVAGGLAAASVMLAIQLLMPHLYGEEGAWIKDTVTSQIARKMHRAR
ncbi:MAG: hypothetical protein AMXMBFR74_11870 [Parvibaculum sp.]|uniref:lipopolysaccharide biosynthesis protein n=1 Tax=Parvibaculum sp. TaxID=2024848 RepID=UPI0035B9C9C1